MSARYYVAHAATTIDSPSGPVRLTTGDSLRWDDSLGSSPPLITAGGPLSDPMTEAEYVAWMQTQRLVKYAEFVEAVREQAFHPTDPTKAARFPGGIIHSFAGTLGADWSAEAVIDVLSRAFLVEWDPQHLFDHQLHVKWNEAPIYDPPRHREAHFDVKQPVVEDLDGAPLPPSCQAGGDVFYAVRAWMRSVLSDDIDLDIELRTLLIALAPHVKADDAIDWESVCQRAMAVCAGAGAPGDATLPEACEWLAYQIHGPTLQPRLAGDRRRWTRLWRR